MPLDRCVNAYALLHKPAHTSDKEDSVNYQRYPAPRARLPERVMLLPASTSRCPDPVIHARQALLKRYCNLRPTPAVVPPVPETYSPPSSQSLADKSPKRCSTSGP